MQVPSDRCGIIIGKGGENIREICRLSGAHVEINRSVPEGGPTKSFTIRGRDAFQIISHKQPHKSSTLKTGKEVIKHYFFLKAILKQWALVDKETKDWIMKSDIWYSVCQSSPVVFMIMSLLDYCA